jgi:hypothetical protein
MPDGGGREYKGEAEGCRRFGGEKKKEDGLVLLQCCRHVYVIYRISSNSQVDKQLRAAM